MKKKLGIMAALAAMVAGGGGEDAVNIFSKTTSMQMQGVTLTSDPADFGLYRAGARAHKQYLRSHHLGKFRKGK